MPYLYETHLHTCRSSACGKSTPEEYVHFYKERGFDGVFITEHFYNGNTSVNRHLPWPVWVHQFTASYREMKKIGDREGLKVFFGWETTIDGDDYLIYGLDEKFLLRHPEMIDWRQKEQYEKIKAAGGLVIQAHPFRCRDYIKIVHLHPFQCDGWEAANCGNRPYENYLALQFASARGMRMTAGSDIHSVSMASAGAPYAMVLDQPLNSGQDYVKTILSGKGYHYRVPETAFSALPAPIGRSVCLYQENGLLQKELLPDQDGMISFADIIPNQTEMTPD